MKRAVNKPKRLFIWSFCFLQFVNVANCVVQYFIFARDPRRCTSAMLLRSDYWVDIHDDTAVGRTLAVVVVVGAVVEGTDCRFGDNMEFHCNTRWDSTNMDNMDMNTNMNIHYVRFAHYCCSLIHPICSFCACDSKCQWPSIRDRAQLLGWSVQPSNPWRLSIVLYRILLTFPFCCRFRLCRCLFSISVTIGQVLCNWLEMHEFTLLTPSISSNQSIHF